MDEHWHIYQSSINGHTVEMNKQLKKRGIKEGFTTQIIEYQDKTLAEICERLTSNQIEVLYLRLCGLTDRECRSVVSFKGVGAGDWELDNSMYQGIEKHVINNRDRYIREITDDFIKTIPLKAQRAISLLTNKVLSGCR